MSSRPETTEAAASQASPRRRHRCGLALLAGLATLGAAAARCHEPSALVAYVACAGNNHVRVIDLETGRTLRRIYTGPTPWRLRLRPDGEQLWVQHWYSATTAVIDRADHEVKHVLPVRGPGAFTPDGRSFVSFSWPGTAARRYDADTYAQVEERWTDVSNVYDVAPAQDGSHLYLAQFDPVTQGPHRRYGYVLRYPLGDADGPPLPPVSLPTGQSPAEVVPLRANPFVITVDRETNGLTLFNERGARRSIPTCPAPQAVAVSESEGRMVVVCWRGRGERLSEVMTYDADFASRPWPALEPRGSLEVAGGLVDVDFAPGAARFYAIDRSHARLLDFDFAGPSLERRLATGDVPVDLVLAPLSAAQRENLRASESASRRALRQALAEWRVSGDAPGDLSWTETTKPLGGAAAAETTPVDRTSRVQFRWPDSLRVESSDGTTRLAQGGHSLSLDPDGRFWTTPRQELLSAVLGLAGQSEPQALRALAGDVPGSPFLRGGIAVDLSTVRADGEERTLVIGSLGGGEPSSQLWLDAESGRPRRLLEQFPSFERGAHDAAEASAVLESRFLDFTRTAGYPLPARIERSVAGVPFQEVELSDIRVDPGTPELRFDPSRLGGVRPVALAADAPPEAASTAPTDPELPGRRVAILEDGYLQGPGQPHAPYNSNPPTSGARLDHIADWGVHAVPIPLELQVHNLEHGGVGIQYRCDEPCPELASELGAFADQFDHVFVAPLPTIEDPIALTAWGRLQTLEKLDRPAIEHFIRAYAGRDHHRGVAPSREAE